MSFRDDLQTSLGQSYTLERELTGGGMARVFVAIDTAFRRPVVVKALSPDVAAAVSGQRFRREIRFASSLQQANIVPVLAAGEANGIPYYIMPFVDGDSLRSHLTRRRALPMHEVVGVLRDLARALAFAHERGIVHRDLTPENVLLSGGTAVVTDFGIAKAVEVSRPADDNPTLTQSGIGLGTPSYTSPEQASGGSHVDQRADIYALGVIAYELLAGAPPFTGPSARALLAAHVVEQPVHIATRRIDAPRRLCALVMQCLEKDPANRPQTATDLLRVLEATPVTDETAPSDTVSARAAIATLAGKACVAVLPFANMSASADDEYFSDGMTEDIIAHLSQSGTLKVISRTSVMQYRKTTKPTTAIAAELGASHLVEGSVRRAANQLRIVAHLVDARSDESLWSQTFDRNVADVFAIQAEVAERVSGALKARLSPEERIRIGRRPTTDLDAYNLYLLGRHHYHRAPDDPAAFDTAISCCERAVARDPSFARAYAMAAFAHNWHAAGYYGMRPRDVFAKMAALASRALALDPDSVEASLAMGLVEQGSRYDHEAGRIHYERALRINPSSADAYLMYAWYLLAVGRGDDVVGAVRQAIELDPGSLLVRGWAVWDIFWAGRTQDALLEVIAAKAHFGALPFLQVTHSVILVALGRAAEAVALARDAYERAPFTIWRFFVAIALGAAGDRDEARRIVTEIRQRESREYVWPIGVGLACAHIGDVDLAFEYMERGYNDRASSYFYAIATSPNFDPLRRDPRFASLVRRVGVATPIHAGITSA